MRGRLADRRFRCPLSVSLGVTSARILQRLRGSPSTRRSRRWPVATRRRSGRASARQHRRQPESTGARSEYGTLSGHADFLRKSRPGGDGQIGSAVRLRLVDARAALPRACRQGHERVGSTVRLRLPDTSSTGARCWGRRSTTAAGLAPAVRVTRSRVACTPSRKQPDVDSSVDIPGVLAAAGRQPDHADDLRRTAAPDHPDARAKRRDATRRAGSPRVTRPSMPYGSLSSASIARRNSLMSAARMTPPVRAGCVLKPEARPATTYACSSAARNSDT